MTPPVQKNHYATGHKYTIYAQVPKLTEKATYIGEYRHNNGNISHVFAKSVTDERGNEHAIGVTFPDESSDFWVGD